MHHDSYYFVRSFLSYSVQNFSVKDNFKHKTRANKTYKHTYIQKDRQIVLRAFWNIEIYTKSKYFKTFCFYSFYLKKIFLLLQFLFLGIYAVLAYMLCLCRAHMMDFICVSCFAPGLRVRGGFFVLWWYCCFAEMCEWEVTAAWTQGLNAWTSAAAIIVSARWRKNGGCRRRNFSACVRSLKFWYK